MADRSVAEIQTQFLVQYHDENGRWRKHYFDICVDYVNGCRVLYAVRNRENSASVVAVVDRIREQELHKHAHHAFVLTEEEITKPLVHRASRILRARQLNNERNNTLVLDTLTAMGGRARMGALLQRVDGVPLSQAADSVWSLIDRDIVVHDHPAANAVDLKMHSWISTKEGALNAR